MKSKFSKITEIAGRIAWGAFVVITIIKLSAMFIKFNHTNPLKSALKQCLSIYKVDGLTGIIGKSKDSYAEFMRKKEINKLQAAVLIDICGQKIDEGMSQIAGFPRNPYFVKRTVYKRYALGAVMLDLTEEQIREKYLEWTRQLNAEFESLSAKGEW